jgi:hypothetical protein
MTTNPIIQRGNAMENTFRKLVITLLLSSGLSAGAEAQRFATRQFIDNYENVMKSAYEPIGGCAKRIAIAEPDHPFVTGCGAEDDTAVLYLNDARAFEPTGVSAATVAAYAGGKTSILALTGAHRSIGFEAPCARDISTGIGSDGQRWDWIIGCSTSPGARDFPIARHFLGATKDGGGMGVGQVVDTDFHPFPGGGVRLAVGLTDGVTWVINSQGDIYRQIYCKANDADETLIPSSGFCKNLAETFDTQIPGCARSIANGGRNRVWIIGCDADARGNGSVYQYSGPETGPLQTGVRWAKRAGRGKEIAVDPDGRPWVVMANGTVWRWNAPVPGKGVGVESDPHVVNHSQDPK